MHPVHFTAGKDFVVEQPRSLGEFLEEARIQNQISINGLAKMANITPRYMRDLLYGNRVPSETVIIGLSEALYLDYDELMKRAGRIGSVVQRHVQRSVPYGVFIRSLGNDFVTDEEVEELMRLWGEIRERRVHPKE